jgi:hypothetical protein
MRKRVGRWSLAIVGVVVGVLLLSPVAAHVNKNFSHLWNDHIKAKADGRYVQRSQAAWARVADNGNLVSGLGIESTSRDDVGTYLVQFKRNVQECAASVTSWTNNLIPGIDTVVNVRTLEVGLVNTANNPVDSPFSIMVRC